MLRSAGGWKRAGSRATRTRPPTSRRARGAAPMRPSSPCSAVSNHPRPTPRAVRRIMEALPPVGWQRRRFAAWLPLAAGLALAASGLALLGGIPAATAVAGLPAALGGVLGWIASSALDALAAARGGADAARVLAAAGGAWFVVWLTRRRPGRRLGRGLAGGARARRGTAVIGVLLAGVLAAAPLPQVGATVVRGPADRGSGRRASRRCPGHLRGGGGRRGGGRRRRAGPEAARSGATSSRWAGGRPGPAR